MAHSNAKGPYSHGRPIGHENTRLGRTFPPSLSHGVLRDGCADSQAIGLAADRVRHDPNPVFEARLAADRVCLLGGLADIDHHLLEPIDLGVERLAALDAREPAIVQRAVNHQL